MTSPAAPQETPSNLTLAWAIAVVEQDAEGDVIGTAAKILLRELASAQARLRERERMVMVPRETLERWLPTMEAGANCNRSFHDKELSAMLSAAPEKE